MHKDDVDLARRLFATALGKLEDATYIACRGQSSDLTAAMIRHEAIGLKTVAQDLVAIADTALALTHQIDTRPRLLRKKSH